MADQCRVFTFQSFIYRHIVRLVLADQIIFGAVNNFSPEVDYLDPLNSKAVSKILYK